MKILVCGGRDFTNKEFLFQKMDSELFDYAAIRVKVDCIVHGNAIGADLLAGRYARERGIQEVICPANWDSHGKAAGHLRNTQMACLLIPGQDVVFAFPGGNGTASMKKIARNKGIQVIEFQTEG